MSKRAVVIGATGLVGCALVKQLAVARHIEKVVTITRRPVAYRYAKVENRVADFDRLEEYADAFKADLLFSCLGTTLKQAGSLAAQRVVDVDYQLHAAQLAAGQGVSHYLLVSSSGANAKSRSPYMRMKGELEDAVQALPFSRISIIRPSLLLGERDHVRAGEKLASVVAPALCVLPGLRKYRPIKGEQVAERLLQCSASGAPGVEIFELDEVFV